MVINGKPGRQPNFICKAISVFCFAAGLLLMILVSACTSNVPKTPVPDDSSADSARSRAALQGLTLISEIQGSVPAPDPNFPTPYPSAGDVLDNSPLLDRSVSVEAVVIGWDDKAGQSNSGRVYHNDRGIFIQEEPEDEDGDPSTSEGVFVQFSKRSNEVKDYSPGTVVRVTGKVVEHFELTAIADAEIKIVGKGELPAPTVIAVDKASRNYYESLEGMRVFLDISTAVSGGTNRFGELYVAPGEVSEVSLRGASPGGLLALAEDAGSGNPLLPRRPESPSGTLVRADIYDRIEGVDGPLAYSFDRYKILVQNGLNDFDPLFIRPSGVASSSDQAALPNATADEVRIASFNVGNFFSAGVNHDGAKVGLSEYEHKKKGLAHAVSELLGSPEIVAIQEAENIVVLQDLADEIGGYRAFLEEGNDNRGIDVGFLVSRRFADASVRQYGKTAPDNTGEDCGDLSGVLFDRPPLVLSANVKGVPLSVINVHFSSRGAPDACRIAQASFVADLANLLRKDGEEVIAIGDFNAFEDERAIRLIESEASLVNLWKFAPEGERYSYSYLGEFQTLDHVLASETLLTFMYYFKYPHISTHYYDRYPDSLDGYAKSDHDPPVLTLNLSP